MKLCPCGTQKRYLDCCGLYLLKKVYPSTPEALMRSRYTAFAEGNFNYIRKTMCGKALENFSKPASKQKIQWLKLEVLNASVESDNLIGRIEFKAHYKENNQYGCIHENSLFHKIGKHWFYTAGEHITGR